jgi:hypothetical protein
VEAPARSGLSGLLVGRAGPWKADAPLFEEILKTFRFND